MPGGQRIQKAQQGPVECLGLFLLHEVAGPRYQLDTAQVAGAAREYGERIVAIYAIRNPDKLAGIPLTLG